MITSSLSPKRGDIWLTNFDPTVGVEIRKIRPAIIVSSDGVGKLPIKLIVPITDWKEYYEDNIWHVRINPDNTNNLIKISAIDVLQLRSVDVQRLLRKIGDCPLSIMEEVAAAIAAVIEYSQ